jgi:serine/threonine-protein kinase ULK/ATG1
MAPEILKNKVYDSKVDLWSVGVILHEVIFGYAPFTSNSLDELQQKIMDDTPIQIPKHIMLSDTCISLLKGLLQRNPAERISFEEFFAHPFVDLDHMTSPYCLPKATQLLNRAVKSDEKQEYLQAQRYYLQAIEYLIPAIQHEKDHAKKNEIREKAKIYLKRSEEIASLIKPTGAVSTSNFVTIPIEFEFSSSHLGLKSKPTLSTQVSSIAVDTACSTPLLKLFEENKDIKRGCQLCLEAEEKLYKSKAGYEEIFNQYQSGIALLIENLKTLPKDSDGYKQLKINIEKWLSKAEYAKEKLLAEQQQSKQPQTQRKLKLDNEEDDENSPYYKHCIVQ